MATHHFLVKGNNYFQLISYFGKDLIEASNLPPKANIIFKNKMEETYDLLKSFQAGQENVLPRKLVWEVIHNKIQAVAYFIYPDERRAEYFFTEVMNQVAKFLNAED